MFDIIWQRISNWFGNYAKAAPVPIKKKSTRKNKDAPGHYKKHYKLRDAVGVLFADRVIERAKKLSGAPSGSGKFLGKYSKALKFVTGKLDPMEKKQALDAAQDWNENGLPAETQLK